MELGLYGKELIEIDGTKLEASASKRKNIEIVMHVMNVSIDVNVQKLNRVDQFLEMSLVIMLIT